MLLNRRGLTASEHLNPVSTTFVFAFQKVTETNPATADLLRLCALLHPDAIPEEIFTDGASELGPILRPVASDPFAWNAALSELLKYSLVRRDPNTRTLAMHRLVQAVIRDGMSETEKPTLADRTVRAMNRLIPDLEYLKGDKGRRLYAQLQACADLIEECNLESVASARLALLCGEYWTYCGWQGSYWRVYHRAMTIWEKMAPDHLDLARCLDELARFPWDVCSDPATTEYFRGRDAKRFYRRALAIREKALGPDHLEVAKSLDNLAKCCGDDEEADRLYRRALAIREKALGPEHPEVVESLNNLASWYQCQGHYEEAERLFQKVLAIQEKAAGPERHHEVTNSLFDLAHLYHEQGRDKEAEAVHSRILALWERAAGPDDSTLAKFLDTLASLYQFMGFDEKAELLYQRVLALKRKAFTPDGPL